MKTVDNIKHGWNNEDFARIRAYMRKPAVITFVIAESAVIIFILVLLIMGKLENFIVTKNIRYNSLAFIVMAVAFLIVQVFAIGYGVLLSMRKYRRPSGKGIFRPSYTEGSSYKALHEHLQFSSDLMKKSKKKQLG
ncbi:MAG: hypothetical protein IJJ76_06070 [Ruminococcus sp.]|uniref:hypothetical protein n=1 Tax=Ruminococcus sp. TaxID=41978 RepID=UPI0025E5C3F3|nr:hypothetical protein [Ruminococcus sp.]MBQ9542780.1 hypothetical protein [Ruminococcus sp.]MBR0529320.1 hypothetical protein [Ruminococcus sp.]